MNEEYDVQTPVTDVTENTEAQSVEENEEGIELTDTASQEEEKQEVKTYTAEEVEKMVNDRLNTLLPKKIEREKRKMEKQYSDKLAKYEETDSILKAGLGTKDISESNQRMREFYKEQGIDIPAYSKPKYSEEDEKILGKAEATKIIDLGFEEMQEEANRLATIGVDKMTPREKVVFNTLADELTHQKQVKELAELGVKDDVTSPTFTIMHEYKTKKLNIYHFDMYRLSSGAEACEFGMDEYLYSGDKRNIVFVEWAENIKDILNGKFIKINIKLLDDNKREIEIIR